MSEGRVMLRDGEVELALFTRREGMLSAVGHDLRLVARRSVWTWDRETLALEGRIEASSVSVVCAREGDRDAPASLSESDRKKIDASLRDDVLKVSKHPEVVLRATFTPDGDVAKITGTLTLVGVSRPFEAEAKREGGRWRARYTLDQTRWGIKPFTALFGAIKVAPEVRVEMSVAEAHLSRGA